MLRFEKLIIRSADLGAENSLPPLSERLDLDNNKSELSEADEKRLFIGYGEVETSFPYRYMDMYDRELSEREYEAAILENEYLKATFMPQFGGKLWSLVDKRTGRELLFANTVVRPCNLAVRNAWLSGGIEWNCGFRGHFPYTCSLISTATTKLPDGTDVLRFYYFERIRACIVQMDFFLPDGEKQLFARMRITNPNPRTVPMYWWSNVATVEKPGDRVIVPADESFTARDGRIFKIKIPHYEGIDVSYPAKNLTANDYFWDLNEDSRKFICQLDRDGYGLFQTSTSLLRGRKLFIWGDSQGGHKWMNFLTDDSESGRYCEIQSGLANTQYECLPMPANTTWEWLEVYGAMQADKKKIHSDWSIAKAEAANQLDLIIGGERLEEILENTRDMAESPAERIILADDGWGALEAHRRKICGEAALAPHLDFGKTSDEQASWISLLESGSIGEHNPEDIPLSYNIQPEWLSLLEGALQNKDSENWYAHYLLGCAKIAMKQYDDAKRSIAKSLALCESAWANYAMAIIERNTGGDEFGYMQRAYELRPNDLSLAKAFLKALYVREKSEASISLFENASSEIRQNARCLLYYAYALARVGRIEEAEKIICSEGKYLVVPDIRECELTITQLWVFIQEQKGFTRETMGEIPRDLDFRMFAKREGWK